MAEHDHGDKAGPAPGDGSGDAFRPPALGLGIDDLDAVTAITCVTGDEAAPERRLDGGELGTELLVDAWSRGAPAEAARGRRDVRHSW
jgi:hypothetical protein